MKVLNCRDAGFDCEGVIRADSEDEVLRQAGEHVQKVHGDTVSPEMATQLRGLIRDEAA
ncbi:MAG TPA: DUF1059 domain-containing protein [Herpetosiphonaceae bacterium]|nr:DUF1059 domain-containing protein [Herpetosiphonaceae bacterium]